MRHVVLTHSAESLPGLPERLRAAGLTVSHAPLIRFAPPPEWSALDRALARLSRYQAIVLTSPRAARAIRRRLEAHGRRLEDLPPVWVVGPSTKAAWGGAVQGVADGTADDLATRLIGARVGSHLLFPCGERRLDVLPRLLRIAGIETEEVVVYRTILASAEDARHATANADLIVVASPSVAELLSEALSDRIRRPPAVAIGPTTAAALAAHGFQIAAIAQAPDAAAVGEAVIRYGVTPDGAATGLRWSTM